MGSTATEARPPRRARRGRRLVAGAAAAALGLAVAAGLGAWAWAAWKGRGAAEVAAAYRAGRPAEARAALGRWLSRDPGSAPAQLWAARLALVDRRMGDAVAALDRARAAGAPREDLGVVRALADGLAGDLVRAEPPLRLAFNRGGPPDPLLDEVLARVYLETYDFHRAALVLERWATDAPTDPKPYLWRAEIDSRRSDAAAALADYREALARDPKSAPARFGLAEGLRAAHRNADAAAAYAAYLELKPDDPAAHLGAGRNAAEMGEPDAARDHLERAAALAPDNPEAHRALADVLTRRGAFDAALRHLDRAVALDPYDLEARHSRSLVLHRLGRTADASADQARATTLRAELGELLAAQNRLVRTPNDRGAQLTITRWMFAHGKAAEGVRWAETVLRAEPGQPDACRLLADHYARIGQVGRANFYRAQAGPSPAPAPAPDPSPPRTP